MTTIVVVSVVTIMAVSVSIVVTSSIIVVTKGLDEIGIYSHHLLHKNMDGWVSG